jgi:YVTN family beta-propeller protein
MSSGAVPVASLLAAVFCGIPQARAQDAYIPNQGSDNMTIVNSRNVSDRITVSVGHEPHESAATHDARYVFVSNRGDGTIAVFDTGTRTELDTDGNPANGTTRIAAGLQPHGLAVTPDDRYLLVTNDGSNDVSVVSIDGFRVIGTVPAVGTGPHMIAITPDGREAWTGNLGGGDVSILDVAKAIADPAHAVVCVTPGGSGSACRIPSGSGTEGVTFARDGKTAYVAAGGSGVTVIDVGTRQVIRTLSIGGWPLRVAIRPDGRRAYVSQFRGTSIAVIDTATNLVVTGEQITGVVDSLGMDFDAEETSMFVGNFDSAMVTVINLADTNARQFIPTGTSPDSALVLPEEVRGVRIGSDRVTLSWDRQYLATAYRVYRRVGTVAGSSFQCASAPDPDPSDTTYVDPDLPAPGQLFTYTVAIVQGTPEGILGYTSTGLLRQKAPACSL